MSLLERLRWAVAPDPRRAMSIVFGGLAVFVALGGVAMMVELPAVIRGLMALVMLAAWLAGACGMVGYFRWFFRSGSSEHTPR